MVSREGFLVIKDPTGGDKLVDLSIVRKGHDKVRQGEGCAIDVGARDARTMFQNSNEVVKEGEEHCLRETGTRPHAIIVAQVLAVLVLLKLVIREDAAPWGELSSDLRLETAEVGKDRNIAGCERQVAPEKGIQAGRDRWEVNVVPNRDIGSAVGVVEVGAAVGGR